MEFYKVKLQMIKEAKKEYNSRIIKTSKDIVDFINSEEMYSLSSVENVILIALDTKNHIIAYTEIAKGGINTCNIDIPSIFRAIFTTNANKFILTHNHPSGDSTPSQTDIDMTKRIEQASYIMGIDFLDHIIIGDNNYTSIMSKIKEM